jgi:hypothetical protein
MDKIRLLMKPAGPPFELTGWFFCYYCDREVPAQDLIVDGYTVPCHCGRTQWVKRLLGRKVPSSSASVSLERAE